VAVDVKEFKYPFLIVSKSKRVPNENALRQQVSNTLISPDVAPELISMQSSLGELSHSSAKLTYFMDIMTRQKKLARTMHV